MNMKSVYFLNRQIGFMVVYNHKLIFTEYIASNLLHSKISF